MVTKILPEFISSLSVDKEELNKFWKSSAFGSGASDVLKDSSTLQDRAFFRNLVSTSGESDQFS